MVADRARPSPARISASTEIIITEKGEDRLVDHRGISELEMRVQGIVRRDGGLDDGGEAHLSIELARLEGRPAGVGQRGLGRATTHGRDGAQQHAPRGVHVRARDMRMDVDAAGHCYKPGRVQTPSIPLLRGLPQWIVKGLVGPFLRWHPVKWLGHSLTHPAVCWVAATVALIGWHIPAAFELALRSESWHEVEHICFLSTSLLFWWPAILPFPSGGTWSRWSIPLYLFFATLPGGALGAFLTFCDRVLYPSYAAAPRLFGISPLEDQIIAGALMWVFGTFVYTIPAVVITIRLLSPQGAPSQKQSPLGLRRIIA